MNPLIKPVIISSTALLLVACGSDSQHADLRHFTEQLRQNPATALPPLSSLQPFVAYHYNSENQRSPFQTPAFQSATGDAPSEERQKTELEKFSLSELKMVGTLMRKGKQWALVKAPDNIVYKVAVGEYLGSDYGKVISVNEEKITVEESVIKNNQWVQHQVDLVLNNA